MTDNLFLDEIRGKAAKLSLNKQRQLLTLIKSWLNSDDRMHQRRGVSIPVRIVKEDRFFNERIENISKGGAFVCTSRPPRLSADHEILLIFNLAMEPEPLKVKARITRVSETGIAVQFNETDPRLSDSIEKEMQNKTA
ncbi:MAG: PilZ domain-containing protein [Desulfobacteraceae bacterium]|nr:PilZ domain-containing protein [Desulfobacteraceae bacterium]